MSPAYKRPVCRTVKKNWYHLATVSVDGTIHRVRVPECGGFWWLYKDLEKQFGSDFYLLWLSDPFHVTTPTVNPIVGMAMARALAAKR